MKSESLCISYLDILVFMLYISIHRDVATESAAEIHALVRDIAV